MTIHLPNDVESSVRAEVVNGHYPSEDVAVAEIVRDYFRQKGQPPAGLEASPPAEPLALPARKPLWERAAELRKSIPEEEWSKLPTDGAEQLDHYLHGSPKRPTA